MSGHAKAQALRFLRVTVYALAAQLAALGHWPGWWALLSMGAGAAEVGLRELQPTALLPVIAPMPARPTETPAPGTQITPEG